MLRTSLSTRTLSSSATIGWGMKSSAPLRSTSIRRAGSVGEVIASTGVRPSDPGNARSSRMSPAPLTGACSSGAVIRTSTG